MRLNEFWISYLALEAYPRGLCCFGERAIHAALFLALLLPTQQSTVARLFLGTRCLPPSEEAPLEIDPLVLRQSLFTGDVVVV